MHITGKGISYLDICERKLWLFHHGIRPEMENVNVQLGMHIQETTFPRKEKDLPLGEIGVVDWADFKDGVIHETKKGKAPGKGDEIQVLYYLWWLNEHGVQVSKAVIHYPKQKKTKEVYWNKDAEAHVMNAVARYEKIASLAHPPAVENFKFCKSCAYFEICYA
jgi:CRISPR-associated exonuclease Cas4